jgi:hypothetical protein
MPSNNDIHNGLGVPKTIASSVVASSHVDVERLVAFLLDEAILIPDEHAHLIGCGQCRRTMVEAASEEIAKRREDSTPLPSI